MDTIVRPPETVSAPTPPRQPWRRNALLIFALLIILILVVASIELPNYSPLAQGSFGFGTLRSDVRETKVDAFDNSGVVFDVPVGREATFRYRFSLRIDGPIPVTIRSIGDSDDWGDGSLGRRVVRLIPDAYAGSKSSFQPWRAFSLGPGDEAIVEMEAAYHGRCLGRGDAMSWGREPITFSVLGMPRHEEVMVGVEMRFVGSGDC